MAERVLTQRALNRALLARQLLLERARLALPRALERMAGLQAQYAPSMYIGLWSRVEGFERDALTRALERRRVVQGTLLRSTIHLVSPRDYWPFHIAIEEGRRAWWLRTRRGALGELEMAEAASTLRAALDDGPLRRTQIEAPRAPPPADLQHAHAALVPHLPGRRRRGRHVALRARLRHARAVRAPRRRGASRAARGGRPHGGLPCRLSAVPFV